MPTAYHPYKSYGESQIAGLLDRYGLPFIYEKPTAVMDEGQAADLVSRFQSSHGPIIEYIGVNGEVGYQKRTEHKLAVPTEPTGGGSVVFPRFGSRLGKSSAAAD